MSATDRGGFLYFFENGNIRLQFDFFALLFGKSRVLLRRIKVNELRTPLISAEYAPLAFIWVRRLIRKAWELSPDEIAKLIGVSRRQLEAWQRDPEKVSSSRYTIERLSAVAGIFIELNKIFPNQGEADGWIRQRNIGKVFGGKTPLEVMMSPQNDGLFRTWRCVKQTRLDLSQALATQKP